MLLKKGSIGENSGFQIIFRKKIHSYRLSPKLFLKKEWFLLILYFATCWVSTANKCQKDVRKFKQ